jgi:deoxycytidylate deaminase|tara:strand:+ start:583 stop:1038 length:456 start_codon:yes stop_codon:yes gene_type:complete
MGQKMPHKEERIISKSREASRKSDCHIGMSAVIVNKHYIVSVGYNRKRFFHKGLTSIHAEIDALNRVKDKSLKGATMFITRYGNKDRSGGSRLAAPCRNCSQVLRKAMKEQGLKSVYYTTTPANPSNEQVIWKEWSPMEKGYQRARHSLGA